MEISDFLYFIIFLGGGGKGAAPPGPVELDKSSLWMDLFSLDSVFLVIVTCNNCYVCNFHIRDRFFGDISHDKCWKKTFQSLQIWNFSWGGYPQTPYKALAIMSPHPPPLLLKRLSYGAWSLIVRVNVVLNSLISVVEVDSDWLFDNLCGSHL